MKQQPRGTGAREVINGRDVAEIDLDRKLYEIENKIISATTKQSKLRAMLAGVEFAKNAPSTKAFPLPERERYVIALKFISTFIDRCDGSTAGWVVRLASMLSDLDRGVVDRVLEKARPGHRVLDPSSVQRGRTAVAFGIKILKDAHTTDDQIKKVVESPNFKALRRLTRAGYEEKVWESARSWYSEHRKRRANAQCLALWDQLQRDFSGAKFNAISAKKTAEALFLKALSI
jgi:hypothetical protein